MKTLASKVELTCVLCSLQSPLLANDSLMEQIKDWCAGEWPSDYQMQEYCIETQTESAMSIHEVLGPAVKEIQPYLGKPISGMPRDIKEA